MKISEAKHYLPLIQAAAEGKTLQVLVCDEWSTVHPDATTDFSSPPDHYRVKPEPREFWICPYGGGDGRVLSYKPAEAYRGFIHVREVIEGEQ